MSESALLTLPLAVLGDKRSLSKESRQEISKLTKNTPLIFLWHTFMAWLVIISSILFAIEMQSVWVSGIAIVVVATRQNVLGLLVHEQSHRLGFRASYGDSLVNFLVAYPLLVLSVERYSQVHLSHHKNFMATNDPDLLRKTGEGWIFPMKPFKLAKLFLTDLLGLNVWQLIQGKKANSEGLVSTRRQPLYTWVKPTYYGLLCVIITYTQSWDIFLTYWLLPLLTFFQVIVRWGAICEHLYIPDASVAKCSPIIIPKWWEKILLKNLNFTLHPYHHYFPGVPFSNLPRIHKIFLAEGLIDEKHIFHGNWGYLKFLLKL